MESDKNIEKLLERYFEATATVSEEETLRAYFSQEDVAPSLEKYAPMFQYFTQAKEERFTKQVPLKPRKNYFKWASIAAAAVLLVGMYLGRSVDEPTQEDFMAMYTPEEIESAEEALAMLGMSFNKGTAQIAHLGEFEKTTNKFLTKE